MAKRVTGSQLRERSDPMGLNSQPTGAGHQQPLGQLRTRGLGCFRESSEPVAISLRISQAADVFSARAARSCCSGSVKARESMVTGNPAENTGKETALAPVSGIVSTTVRQAGSVQVPR